MVSSPLFLISFVYRFGCSTLKAFSQKNQKYIQDVNVNVPDKKEITS
jgi:hypothetical protein